MSISEQTIQAMTRGFIDAMLWSDAVPADADPEIGETGNLQGSPTTDGLKRTSRELCERFADQAAEGALYAHMFDLGSPDGGHPAEYIGHTFYLRAAGHGVRFQDRGPEEYLKRLDALADTFTEVEGFYSWENDQGAVDLNG